MQSADQVWRGFPYIHHSTGSWRCWLLGELYGTSNPPHVLEMFVKCEQMDKFGTASLNGHFLLFAYNEASREWHVWTDRLGTMHAYYGTKGTHTAIGTFSPAVAQSVSANQLDWEALTGFFSLGYFPEDRTFWSDVRILKPATHYVWDESGALIRECRYWEWSHKIETQRTFEDTVQEFGTVFQQVMDEHLSNDRVGIPISGGLDSRSTVAAVSGTSNTNGTHTRYWAYSYGYSPESVETRIARQIAERRELPFKDFVVRPYLFDKLSTVMASVEGFQDLTQCRQACVTDELRSYTDVVLAAHWGDVWLDDMGWDKWQATHDGSRTTDATSRFLVRKMQKKGCQWLHTHLCRSMVGKENPSDLTKSQIDRVLRHIPEFQDVDFRVKAYKTEQWSFRWTLASLRMFQSASFPRLPFYDTRLTDFLCTVPTEFLKGRRLQIEYLKAFAPDLAGITWQPYDTNLYRYQWFNSWLLPKRALKKAWRVLTRQQPIQRNWEVQFYSRDGRQGLEQWLLKPGLKLHEFVPARDVKALLHDFYTLPIDAGRGYTVSMLLTFSCWLEAYG